MSATQIIQGTINNLLNREEELFQTRIAICRQCPLYYHHAVLGFICNSQLYLNLITGETSTVPLPGTRRGCGCVLGSKTRVIDAKCPVDK
jgi:hypothetical protein